MTETIPETIPIDELWELEENPNECPVCQGIIANCFIDGVEAETCLSCETNFYSEKDI